MQNNNSLGLSLSNKRPYKIKQMNKKHFVFIIVCMLLLTACTQPGISRLVGNDRDEHGCKGSAGYTWSYALHNCVRLWEAGIRFDSEAKSIFLIFSEDSTFAEIFPPEGGSIICKRQKKTNVWKSRKGKEKVCVQDSLISIEANHLTYTYNK